MPQAKAKLPPDPDGQNDDRSDWAERALQEFMKATRCDPEDAVHDLLTDLGHYCDRRTLEDPAAPTFAEEVTWANRMYREETDADEKETEVAAPPH